MSRGGFSQPVFFDLAVALVFGLVAIIFVFAALFLGRFVRPKGRPFKEKLIPYECAEVPVGRAWFNFNPRFYIFAIAFIIFDIEIIFIFPTVVFFRTGIESGMGLIAFIEIAIFILIFVIALFYLWGRGDLEWIKTIKKIKNG